MVCYLAAVWLHFLHAGWYLQPMEVYVDDDSKLTLHGLQQHYVKLRDNEKNRKLFDLLDALEFNQVCRTLSIIWICGAYHALS